MLEMEGLHKRFGDRVALDGMTFSVPVGEVFGFLGPNGAGKTTAMRAMFGIVELDAGTVRWDGRPVDRDVRRQFGYLPEERGLYPAMGVLEQLVYLGRLRGMPAEAATSAAAGWLGRLGLAERAEARVDELSLGNQQRVQLAAALLHGPRVLVLDEPFSGLDPVAVDNLGSVLREQAAAGTTVLFSSHQLDLVEHFCESVAIVDAGRVVATGTVATLTRTGRKRRRLSEVFLEAVQR